MIADAGVEARRRIAAKLPPSMRVDALFAGENNRASLWQPSDENAPQKQAYWSTAQVIGYGGQAGGGKSDLLLGRAFTRHKKAAIFRRVSPNLDGIIQRSIEIVGDGDGFNKTEKVWNLGHVRLEFESCQYEDDKKKQQGRDRDFLGFDEVTEFTETQVRFIMGWLRSVDPNQDTCCIMTFNPPTDEEGEWVIRYFAPWLDPEYPNPAEDGEVRYFATVSGEEIEVDSAEPFYIENDGGVREKITPQSRTFIRARLADNPYLRDDAAYNAVLDSLPEPLRTLLKHGDFTKLRGVDPFRIIHPDWVRAAQRRWLERVQPSRSPDCVGVDVARGGRDKTAFAPRWGEYFGEPVDYPGIVTPNGPSVATLMRQAFAAADNVHVDVIGVGGSAFDHLTPIYAKVVGVNASEKSEYRDRSKKLRMKNVRAEMYWRMRDALDPDFGSSIALPPGSEIVADLSAARYMVMGGGVVQVEKKEEIKQRIGRSPDVGEALMLANYMPPVKKKPKAITV